MKLFRFCQKNELKPSKGLKFQVILLISWIPGKSLFFQFTFLSFRSTKMRFFYLSVRKIAFWIFLKIKAKLPERFLGLFWPSEVKFLLPRAHFFVNLFMKNHATSHLSVAGNLNLICDRFIFQRNGDLISINVIKLRT